MFCGKERVQWRPTLEALVAVAFGRSKRMSTKKKTKDTKQIIKFPIIHRGLGALSVGLRFGIIFRFQEDLSKIVE